jgi:GTP-binding protein Era
VHFIVAKRGDGVPGLLDDVAKRLPTGDSAYGEDEMTDRSERFLAAEFVREQVMLRFSDELPYAAAVEIERFEDAGDIARIGAVIWVEREGQKAIVIGTGGQQLKAIGTAARLAMEKMFGRRVFLELWVRVRESWSDDEAMLRKLGYEE